MSNLKTSLLVNRQVPEFIREEYPLFITFLEAYYEYLETKQGSELNDLTTKAKDLRYLSDVDSSIDDFESNFFNSYASLIPKDVQVDKAFLIKNVLPLYLSKGSEGAFKLLFRMLFNDEVEVLLPKNNVLRASDGKWTIDNVLRIETDIRSIYTAKGNNSVNAVASGNTTFLLAQEPADSDVLIYVNDVLKTELTDYYFRKETKKLIFYTAPAANSEVKIIYSDFNIELLNNRKVTGITSGATALIEKATRRIITDQLNLGFPFELFINEKTLLGSFEQGELVETNVIADDGSLITLEADTFSFVNRINVIQGGASYNVGDVVTVTGGGASEDATAIVDDVVEGYIDAIVVADGGAGFSGTSNITVSGISPLLLDVAISGIDTTGAANSTSNTYSINNDVIGDYANTLISAANYGFPSTTISTGENVSTVIVDALTLVQFTNLGPVSNIIVIYSNTSTAVSPLLEVDSPTYAAGNSIFGIDAIGSVGRIRINNGGTGYAVGDEIVFGNNPWTAPFGQGAAAAVNAVLANGQITQIEIQPSRIAGTANILNNTAQLIGTGTNFGTDIRVGDRIVINNESRYINSISNTTHANVNVNFTSTATAKKIGNYTIYPLGGKSYVQGNFPPLSVSSISGVNANIEISSIMGAGESLTPYIGNTQPGEIISIKVLSGGSGYEYIPQVDLTGVGDGLATANAQIEAGYATLPGRWTTSDSILSTSERKLQGRDYYVDYSYVTSSLTEFKKYKNILKQLMHPAGFINYADLNEFATITSNTITISTTSTNTISGTVAVTNNSIYVTGTNTKFNVANTKGTLTVGDNVSVSGVIRTVSDIISNTNLAVSVAFTSNASAQTLIILT
jgi:hypothetical protein